MYNTAKLCQYQQPDDQPNHETDGSEDELQVVNNANSMFQLYLQGNATCDEWQRCRAEVNRFLLKNYSFKEIQKWKVVIDSNDASSLWRKIDWKGELQNSTTDVKSPSPESLANHFESKSHNVGEEDDTFVLTSDYDKFVPELDRPITVEEVNDECKRLKPSKSTFDGWSPRMITSISAFLFPTLSFIFNFILLHSIFPTAWITTLVNAIFKNKGSRTLATYYRPVSLVHMLSKLFDFILLSRFKKWFIPVDEQSAYQPNRSCADNIFLIRCLVNVAKCNRKKLFLIAVAFDGVNRNHLFRKLVKVGAGAAYVACLMAIYRRTEYIIFGNKNDHATYFAQAGIKQGSPLSPYLFLFYINDISDFFLGAFSSNCLYELVHILMHADDAVLIASSRLLAIQKLKHLLEYCRLNSIKLEASKSQFIVINGDDSDQQPLHTDLGLIANRQHLSLLGSHLSASGNISDDIKLHFDSRFKSCIKFYNFLRENKLAPLFIKLKVLKSCVLSNCLYNCETFGCTISKDLEKCYYSLLKACLGIRKNVPNDIVLIESGFLPLTAIVYGRQLNFYRKFKSMLKPQSTRYLLFNKLIESSPSYLRHYVHLDNTYNNKNEIYFEFLNRLKNSIRRRAADGNHYKFKMYLDMNTNLEPSTFINHCSSIASKITKFRLGSHYLPVETGRWCRIPRNERLCKSCGVLGDEMHLIYHCREINRTDLVLPNTLNDLWKCEDVVKLFQNIDANTDYL